MRSGPHLGPSSSSKRLTEFLADPRRGLWSLAVPMMLGMSVQTTYMVVDMIFVGRVSAEALTALAFNMPILFFGIGVTFGLGSGATAAIAHFIGAGDKRSADSTAEHAVVLGLLLSFLFAFVGLRWGRPILSALGVGPDLMEPAWSYFSILAGGYVFSAMSVFFRSILSGEGNMKTPMMVLGGATLLNIGLDPLFIFTLGLGVRGAALATVVSQAAATTLFVYLLFGKRDAFVSFAFAHFRPSASILGKILRIGAPASLSFLIMAFGAAVFNRILVERSPDAVAAYQLGARLDHVFMLPILSMAVGLVTLVAMFRGAGRPDLVREIVAYALKRAVVLGLVIGTVFFAFAPSLASMFTPDPGVRAACTSYLRIIVFGYPFIAVSVLAGRTLQGFGLGIPMFVLAALRVLVISAPLAYLLVFRMGRPVESVWLAMVAGFACAAGVAGLWLHSALHRLEAG